MHSIVRECLTKNLRFGDGGRQSEEVLVGLDGNFFGDRTYAAKDLGANGHAAGAQEGLAQAKHSRAFQRVGLKTKTFKKRVGLSQIAGMGNDDSVAHNADRGVGGQSMHHLRLIYWEPTNRRHQGTP